MALLTASILSSLVLGQTPPSFSPSSDISLPAAFGNYTISPPGARIPLNATKSGPPTLTLPPTDTSTLLLIIDLDTPYGSLNRTYAPYLHFLLPSIPPNTTILNPTYYNSTQATSQPALVKYVAPNPPAGSPEHRFVVLAFEQEDSTFVMPEGFEGFLGGELLDRIRFDVDGFVEAAGLGSLKAANWFTVVPDGGNGTASSRVVQSEGKAAGLVGSGVAAVAGAGVVGLVGLL